MSWFQRFAQKKDEESTGTKTSETKSTWREMMSRKWRSTTDHNRMIESKAQSQLVTAQKDLANKGNTWYSNWTDQYLTGKSTQASPIAPAVDNHSLSQKLRRIIYGPPEVPIARQLTKDASELLEWRNYDVRTKSNQLRAIATERSKVLMDKALAHSKEILHRTKDTTVNYSKEKIADISVKVDESVQRVKQGPQHMINTVKATTDDLAMKSIARAKRTRNFLVLVFLGGCSAFGLGLGLGVGGIRRHVE